MSRIVILGGPRTGKTTLAEQVVQDGHRNYARHLREAKPGEQIPVEMNLPATVRHTDNLMHLGWSEASEHVAREWLDAPGPWIIEGVALARALRKWREAHPGEPPPVDRVIRLTTPHVELTKGQAAMAKGEETVWREIEQWLLSAPDVAVEEHGGSSSHVVA